MSQSHWSERSGGFESSTHSKLFDMQLDELLKSLKPKYEVEFIDADRVIKKLRETIESIPDRESIVVGRMIVPTPLSLS